MIFELVARYCIIGIFIARTMFCPNFGGYYG